MDGLSIKHFTATLPPLALNFLSERERIIIITSSNNYIQRKNREKNIACIIEFRRAGMQKNFKYLNVYLR